MTPAGWYRDPDGPPGLLRWWDGREWTQQTRSEADEQPAEGTGDLGHVTEAGVPPDGGASPPSGERSSGAEDGPAADDPPADDRSGAATETGRPVSGTAAEPGAAPSSHDGAAAAGSEPGGTSDAAPPDAAPIPATAYEAAGGPAARGEQPTGAQTQAWSPAGGGQPSPGQSPWPPAPGQAPAGWALPDQMPGGPPPSGQPYGAWPPSGQVQAPGGWPPGGQGGWPPGGQGGWPPPGQGTWQYPEPAWGAGASPDGRRRIRMALLIGSGVAAVVVILVVVTLLASGIFGGTGGKGGRSPVAATITDTQGGISYAGLGGAWHRETISPAGGLASLGFDQGEVAVVMKNYDNGEPYVASAYSGVVPIGATGSLEATAKALLATLEPASYPPHTRQDLSSASHPVDGHDGWLLKVRFDFPEAKARGWNFRSETAAMLVVDRGNGQQPAEFYVSIPDGHKQQGDLDLLLSSLKVS